MARMHTKKHGKSSSLKPMKVEKADVDLKGAEKAIEEYAKQGMGPAAIGNMLKVKHGIGYIKHTFNKRLVQILKEKGLASTIPSDMLDLMKKAVRLHKHIDRNGQDQHNRTSLKRIESKIFRLTKYYVREGVLPKKWKYDPEKAELLIRGKA
ncbi:MAG: 30S ribosomal protein S15 [Candidatus Marsarchaeota archaeon]|jgi:small subunit ribosomal protein S15|nr:30S ribosomal protein S15 [Candidatus Marsarchaeota archaeon]